MRSRVLAPSSPIESALEGSILRKASIHLGIDAKAAATEFDVLQLGELKFVARKRSPSAVDPSLHAPVNVASEVREEDRKAREDEDVRAQTAWEADLLLAEFIREHCFLVAGRRVMELSAGIGAAGFAAAEAGAARVVLTDSSERGLAMLYANRDLNEPWLRAGPAGAAAPAAAGGAAVDECNAKIHELRLDAPEEDIAEIVTLHGKPDTLLGADVVHNAATAEALASLTPKLLSGDSFFVLAHEVRHAREGEDGSAAAGGAGRKADESLRLFLTRMGAAGFEWKAARLHKTEAAMALPEPSRKPQSAQISSPALGGLVGFPTPSLVGLSLGPSAAMPDLALGGGAAEAAPAAGLSIAAPAEKPELTVEAHVEALPLDEMGPGTSTETASGDVVPEEAAPAASAAAPAVEVAEPATEEEEEAREREIAARAATVAAKVSAAQAKTVHTTMRFGTEVDRLVGAEEGTILMITLRAKRA